MDRNQFAREMFKLFQQGFPELYAAHVRDRRSEFIKENAPMEELIGEKLGKVPAQLQMLWALAQLCYDKGPHRWPEGSTEDMSLTACRNLQAVNLQNFSELASLGFWECVMDRFETRVYPRTQTLCVSREWIVSLVPVEDVPEGEKAHSKFHRLAMIALVIARTHYGLSRMIR